MSRTIYIATRGSALALAQSNMVLAQCERNFPGRGFELKIIKTTGDKLQTVSLPAASQQISKGLFTKELEIALLNREADFAVHSLKDLPTELPEGLCLAAVSEREDVRDVLIYRDGTEGSGEKTGYGPGLRVSGFRPGATVGTSSTRRSAQLVAVRPDLKTVPIRGNVGTRLRKLMENPELDGIILALAGLKRLGYRISTEGRLEGRDVPTGLLASVLPVEEMLPCVGQAALGFESRLGDAEMEPILARLNHAQAFDCVTAERAFLHGMGGGCLSPVAAYGEVREGMLYLRAVSFRNEQIRRTEKTGDRKSAAQLGREAAAELL